MKKYSIYGASVWQWNKMEHILCATFTRKAFHWYEMGLYENIEGKKMVCFSQRIVFFI
jgi:hypothetical protein